MSSAEDVRTQLEVILGNINIGLPGAQRYLQPNEIKELMRALGPVVDDLTTPAEHVFKAAADAYIANPDFKGVLSGEALRAAISAGAQAAFVFGDDTQKTTGAIQSATAVPGTGGRARSVSVDWSSTFRTRPGH
jgi:hypothetical protein